MLKTQLSPVTSAAAYVHLALGCGAINAATVNTQTHHHRLLMDYQEEEVYEFSSAHCKITLGLYTSSVQVFGRSL